MRWELDHIFFATTEPSDAEAALTKAGLSFSRRITHLGQGTSNACARYDGGFLEILYPTDLHELRSPTVAPLALDQRTRWRDTGACPFGLCFRPSALGATNDRAFPTWDYAAPYLPEGVAIAIVTPRFEMRSPLIFLNTRRRTAAPKSAADSGSYAMKRIVVQMPTSAAPLAAGVQWFVENELFAVLWGSSYALHLEWANGQAASTPLTAGSMSVPITMR